MLRRGIAVEEVEATVQELVALEEKRAQAA
jgi:hypothetical protein